MSVLTAEQNSAIRIILLRLRWARDNEPEALSYLLGGATGEEIDVTTTPLSETLYHLADSFYISPALTIEKLNELSIPYQKDVLITIGGEIPSFSGNSFSGDCDCDNLDIFTSPSHCIDECLDAFYEICDDYYADNYAEEGDCEYDQDADDPSDPYGFGDPDEPSWWQNAGNYLLEVADDIGWDAIWGWAISVGSGSGGDSGGDSGGGSGGSCPSGKTSCKKDGVTGCHILADCDKAGGTAWGTIALWTGAVVVVGVGIYLIVRRRR